LRWILFLMMVVVAAAYDTTSTGIVVAPSASPSISKKTSPFDENLTTYTTLLKTTQELEQKIVDLLKLKIINAQYLQYRAGQCVEEFQNMLLNEQENINEIQHELTRMVKGKLNHLSQYTQLSEIESLQKQFQHVLRYAGSRFVTLFHSIVQVSENYNDQQKRVCWVRQVSQIMDVLSRSLLTLPCLEDYTRGYFEGRCFEQISNFEPFFIWTQTSAPNIPEIGFEVQKAFEFCLNCIDHR